MEKSLFAYAWRYSRAEQLKLLVLTVISFPVLYVSLELPKLIINDAIGGAEFPRTLLGIELSQVSYLAVLCAAFLFAVIAGGLLKMVLNTYKGSISERLLRRFRFALITRIIRFPLPHFRRTSQGELISMVTAESEPLGAMMGELIAQPLFLAGQMLTILAFLFLQSFWFGLASVALIPLQAYVIPMLQRRINMLQKERITKVRGLSQTIGETVAGVEDLRANNAVRYQLADFTARLHEIFVIRLDIFRRKFFMKFLNTFINQLTPFFFFSIGGYLVIQGELTLGALVAALSAFKDLSAPWRELLIYYNQIQDYGLRYRTIIEQFEPPGMIEEHLITGAATASPNLKGPVNLMNVTLGESNRPPLITELSLEIPAGAMAAIQCPDALARRALVQALSRNLLPQSGQINIAETSLARLHQSAISARIGVVSDEPYIFDGSIGHNGTLGLRPRPLDADAWPEDVREQVEEAKRAGNSPDPIATDWLDPTFAGCKTYDELRDWWLQVARSIGTDEALFHRGLGALINPAKQVRLSEAVINLRAQIRVALADKGLTDAVVPFDTNAFHPGLSIFENLVFAIKQETDEELPARVSGPDHIIDELRRLEILGPLYDIGQDLSSVIVETFGEVGANHPLFARLGIDKSIFEELKAAYHRGCTIGEVEVIEDALLLALLFNITADQFGGVLPAHVRQQILQIREQHLSALRNLTSQILLPLDEAVYVPGLTILENALFGKLASSTNQSAAERVLGCVIDVFDEAGLRADVALTHSFNETGIGGSALPPVARDRIAYVRAILKRPDIVILDRFFPNHTQQEREDTRRRLRDLLPEATIITLETKIEDPQAYDTFVEIIDGRLAGHQPVLQTTAPETSISADVARRLYLLRATELFHALPESQLQLLAFASDWIKFPVGTTVFQAGEAADAAYLFVEGRAELRWPTALQSDDPIQRVEPGRMVGDLAVLTRDTRVLNLITTTDVQAIRIRGAELLEIVEHDAAVAFSLLQTVAGHLKSTGSEYAAFRLSRRDT